MNTLKKIGQILLCPIPMIVMLLVQVICTSVCMVVLAIAVGPDTFQTVFFDHYTAFLLLIQVLSLIIFGVWYYVAYCLRKPLPRPGDHFTRKDVGLLLLLGLGLYCVISMFMIAASYLAPDLMAEYEALIEESGLADLTLISTLATLILAPLSEELVFRGITHKLASKAFGSFWAANIVQALLFGIAHLNWIQGIYAFVLGLVLGYVCYKCRTLYAGILLHLSFNFFGTYLAMLLGYVPLPELATSIILFVIGLPITWLCLTRIQPKLSS